MSTVVRGCGSRIAGGIYATTDLVDSGLPIEAFIVDPPTVIDEEAIGLTPIGVTMIERDGVYHVVDWVGSKFYPNVADFIEELRRFGLSRRLSRKLDFSRLSKDSRILLAHSRAHITPHEEYRAGIGEEVGCPIAAVLPRHKHSQRPVTEMCAGLWWHDLALESGVALGNRLIRRELPSFAYTARCRPKGVQPSYRLAIFLSLPIRRLAVIKDKVAATHDEAMSRAQESSLPVELEDE